MGRVQGPTQRYKSEHGGSRQSTLMMVSISEAFFFEEVAKSEAAQEHIRYEGL